MFLYHGIIRTEYPVMDQSSRHFKYFLLSHFYRHQSILWPEEAPIVSKSIKYRDRTSGQWLVSSTTYKRANCCQIWLPLAHQTPNNLIQNNLRNWTNCHGDIVSWSQYDRMSEETVASLLIGRWPVVTASYWQKSRHKPNLNNSIPYVHLTFIKL